jgi:hypothetical protein
MSDYRVLCFYCKHLLIKDIKMLRKKFLPYSKPLADLIKSGFAPSNDVNVFLGQNAWAKGKKFAVSYPERTLVLPPWENPSDFYWPVKECDVLVCDTGYAELDYLHDLALCLYESAASIVRMISPDFKITIYHKE